MIDDSSYEKVNYLLRLRKQIERKMIIELLQRFSRRIELDKYDYIGFGSIYFADFILFHKYLHIDNMFSLEKDIKKEKRFLFNKPFDFIKLKMVPSNEFLDKLINWEKPLLIWFDYDYGISEGVIEDIKKIAYYAKPEDFLFITVDAKCSSEPDEVTDFLDSYRSYIGSDIDEVKAIDNFPFVLYRIITSVLSEAKDRRMSPIKISQLLNLTYKDTCQMYTYGCIFELPASTLIADLHIDKLKFYSPNETIFNINCPLLTPKEKYHLDSCINEEKKCVDIENEIGLDLDELKTYDIFYKYYPQFFESIY